MDLTSTLITKILDNASNRQIPGGLIFPVYEGQSILNIPATTCHWFGIPILHASPLIPEITGSIPPGVHRIILILVDALALLRFQNWVVEGKLPLWEHLIKTGLLAPITSILPSTTSSAMTTLWTGRSPAEHATAGYELWLKEYGVVTNMITQSPMYFKGSKCSIEQAGYKPEKALPFTTLGEHLKENHVQTHAFQHHSIAFSGLSKSLMKDVSINPFSTDAELWTNLRRLLSSSSDEQLFAWVYSGTYDNLAHRYGPDDERAELDFINFSHSFEHNFYNRLSSDQKKGTLVLLTADHGQISTSKDPAFDLKNHPEFLQALHIRPTGEHRCVYLHVRPGKTHFIKEYIENVWPGKFTLHESQQLIVDGYFGPGKPAPQLTDRLGDLTLIANGSSYLWWSDDENNLLGRHGGMTPEEMLVPFLASRLI